MDAHREIALEAVGDENGFRISGNFDPKRGAHFHESALEAGGDENSFIISGNFDQQRCPEFDVWLTYFNLLARSQIR